MNAPRDESGSETTHRLLLGVVGPIVCVAIVSLPMLVTWSELPDPINVSWGPDGQPNNATPPGDFLGYNVAVGVFCALMCIVAALKKLPTAMLNATAGLLAGIVAPLFAVTSLQIALANRGIADWTEAPSPPMWWIAAVIAASLLGAVVVSFPLRNLFRLEPMDVASEQSAGLTIFEGQTASWHSQATSPWWRVVAIAFIPFGVVMVGAGIGFGGSLSVAGLFVFCLGLLFLAFSRVNVSIDRRGFTVQYGALPWPKNHIRLASIRSAEAVHVKPLEHGGWGYRGSRKLLGRAAVVVRTGQGIRLALADGTDFIVTVDNADQGAGVLNDLRARV